MESETKRVNKNDEKPNSEAPAPVIYLKKNNQQEVKPVNTQQNYMPTNQGIYPQQQYIANQPIPYQPIYNQAVFNPTQPNVIITSQPTPVLYRPIEFKRERVRMICPYCSNSIRTNVKQSFNCCKQITNEI